MFEVVVLVGLRGRQFQCELKPRVFQGSASTPKKKKKKNLGDHHIYESELLKSYEMLNKKPWPIRKQWSL